MKKTISIVLLVLAILMSLFLFIGRAEAYNVTWFDTTYHFDKVQIRLPNDIIVSGAVESWKDWEDSDAVQVKVNGKTYYTHISNVVLIAE